MTTESEEPLYLLVELPPVELLHTEPKFIISHVGVSRSPSESETQWLADSISSPITEDELQTFLRVCCALAFTPSPDMLSS